MKYDPYKSFGYPVLRADSDDYVNGDIQAFAELESDEQTGEFYLDYSVLISVDVIKELVDKSVAKLCITLTCSKTLFSKSFQLSELIGKISVDLSEFRGNLDVLMDIVLVDESLVLVSPQFNPEYGVGVSFPLSKGAILAQGQPQRFVIEREVFQNIVGLFEYKDADHLNPSELVFVPEEASVSILMHPDLKAEVSKYEGSAWGNSLLLNTIFLPAITFLINEMLRNESEYEGHKWLAVLQQKLSDESLDGNSDPFKLAQKILKYPLGAFRRFNYLGETVED